MTDHCHCPHQWNQTVPITPAWVLSVPQTKVCPQPPPVTPNPTFPTTATLTTCTPLEIKKTGPSTVLVTVSIPTEAIITLPTKALEIKMINKKLKLTQSRLFSCALPVCGIPHDTPKLFLGGTVRKDIQYSEAIRQTATTVEGTLKDFVIEIPFNCVVDLGCIPITPPLFSQRQEYEYSSITSLLNGFSSKDKLMSGDLNEFNIVSQEFLNTLPSIQLVFSRINEMDDALDRVPLPGGPFEEGVFRTVQEKMIVLIQVRLTFPVNDSTPIHRHCRKPKSDELPSAKVCSPHHPRLSKTAKLLKRLLKV